jgi:hypothetical protein
VERLLGLVADLRRDCARDDERHDSIGVEMRRRTGARRICNLDPELVSQPRQFAATIAVRSWWLCGLCKGRTH